MNNRNAGIWFHLLDVLFNVVIIVAVVVGIRTFLISPFQVEGSSMIDTLEDREYIIINKLAYIVGKPARGDVVVFHPPNDPSKYYVKRVIGLPGDEIIIKQGFVYLIESGTDELRKLDEAGYLNSRNEGNTFRSPPSIGDKSEVDYEVPADEYFVLGDNRQGSLDSRSFVNQNSQAVPYVKRNDIKGKVWVVALPVTKIHALEPPQYGF